MAGVSREAVLDALSRVQDPELGMSVLELRMIKSIEVGQDGVVKVVLALTTEACPLTETLKHDVEAAISELGGKPSVELTVMTKQELDEVTALVRKRYGDGATYTTSSSIPVFGHGDIMKILAVGSGKGGVGKSLMAAMTAVELRRAGFDVGILDADITGASVSEAFGLGGMEVVAEGNKIVPLQTKSGIKAISMNLFMDNPEGAVIWRGPLVTKAIQQFYSDVAWGKLHYLIIDMPPGTSDAAITVFQSLPVDGVVVVSSPQGVANLIVGKFINMAKTVKVPVIGLVENMAYARCPCGDVIYPFGHPSGQETAEKHGIPFLGELPVDLRAAELMDAGHIEDYASREFQEAVKRIRLQAQMLHPSNRLRRDWQLQVGDGGS